MLITTFGLIISNGIVYLNEEFLSFKGNMEIDVFSIMVNIFGGLFGVFISIILPVINYAAVNGKRKIKSIIGYLMTIGFFFVGLVSFGYSFYEIIHPVKKEEE